jgi:hypothetical protein
MEGRRRSLINSFGLDPTVPVWMQGMRVVFGGEQAEIERGGGAHGGPAGGYAGRALDRDGPGRQEVPLGHHSETGRRQRYLPPPPPPFPSSPRGQLAGVSVLDDMSPAGP